MYVPTVGMNWEITPTHRPSASAYGTPIANRNSARDDGRHDRLDATRVEVAARLVDRDLPRVEHHLLALAREP